MFLFQCQSFGLGLSLYLDDDIVSPNLNATDAHMPVGHAHRVFLALGHDIAVDEGLTVGGGTDNSLELQVGLDRRFRSLSHRGRGGVAAMGVGEKRVSALGWRQILEDGHVEGGNIVGRGGLKGLGGLGGDLDDAGRRFGVAACRREGHGKSQDEGAFRKWGKTSHFVLLGTTGETMSKEKLNFSGSTPGPALAEMSRFCTRK